MASLKALESRDHYTIGWIAALPLELAAATAMLDELHKKPLDFVQPSSDKNSYTWGRIGEHNVVIASLPSGVYGTTSAATTAISMLHSFLQVRVGLMVGIGAAIPRLERGFDIRLGDIVVSRPGGQSGGVVQYDLGKARTGHHFERRGILSMPPETLLKALTTLDGRHEKQPSKVPEFLEDMVNRNPYMAKSKQGKSGFVHQGEENDRLFKAAYQHVDGSDCRNCDPNQEISRDKRDSTNPAIHYGTIASGSTLVKDAAIRDSIAQDTGEECICLDMEAAGLMNSFPCLVVRGICDYADSHKNDRWQRYAAATAAAYVKELLGVVPSEKLQRTPKAVDILKDSECASLVLQNFLLTAWELHKMKAISAPQPKRQRVVLIDYTPTAITTKSSSGYPPQIPQRTTIKRYSGVRRDQVSGFLKKGFLLNGRRNEILSYGFMVVPDVARQFSVPLSLRVSATVLLALNPFYITTLTSPIRASSRLKSMMRSLISQLYSKWEDARKYLDLLFSSCVDGGRQPNYESLSNSILHMIDQVKEVWIVLDALDECSTRRDPPMRGLLSWMKNLLDSKQRNVHLLITSRPEQDIKSKVNEWSHKGYKVPIQADFISGDIRAYVHKRVRNDVGLQRWIHRTDVQKEIEDKIMEKADGMFRWAACQLDTLKDCLNYKELTNALTSLPKTLNETYDRILRNIPSQHIKTATRILQFLAFSERPLQIKEVVDAIAVDPKEKPHFDPLNRLPDLWEISRYCSSLVVVVSTKEDSCNRNDEEAVLQLAHYSVKEYLTPSEVCHEFKKDFQETTAKASIAILCPAYLLHLDQELPVPEILENFPFAYYCARNWMSHAAASGGEDKELHSLIMEFFSNERSYTNWYYLYDSNSLSLTKLGHKVDRPPGALYCAALGGLYNELIDLLDKGADVNARGGEYGNALQAAAVSRHERMVRLLLDKGADVNAQSGVYGNALQAAAQFGHERIVQLLLEKSANVNAQGGEYGNALQAAASEGHEKMVQLLLDNGADLNAQGGEYGSALQAAAASGHARIVQLLLGKGADINARGGEYGNALKAAAAFGHAKMVQLLLDKGADVNAQGGHYGNALQAAAASGQEKMVQLLVDKGADVNAQGGYYGNSLQAAAVSGQEKMVQLLVGKGADVNAQGGKYGYALQAAAASGHEKIVQMLLEKSKDIHSQAEL